MSSLIAPGARAQQRDLSAAYRACETLTRERAGNFYYGIRLLPAVKRHALCAVYAYARRIDDIGDGDDPPARKLALLAAAHERLHGDTGEEMWVALRAARSRFDLPLDALDDLIVGVEMDVRGEHYATFDELVVYCRRVAGSIGRLCLAIFDCTDRARAAPLAEDLGVALQLTNILRDVREDLDHGRVYLPAQDRKRFGSEDLRTADSDSFRRLILFEAERAHHWFDRGLGLLDLIDYRSGACVAAMAGIYRCILERIERDPEAVRERRISLPTRDKAWIAARSLAGVTR
jgi:phytoene synthase